MKLKLENTLKIVISSLLLLSFNANSEDASSSVKACNQALEKADFNNAVLHAEAALKQEATLQPALLCKGRALGALGKQVEAEQTLLLAQQHAKPGFDTTIAHLVLGNFYRNNQQLDQALSSYQKSLEASQQDNNQKFTLIGHNLMGATYSDQNKHQLALSSYEAGEKLAMNDNERADSFERLAQSYQALNKLDKAIEFQLKGTMMQKKSGTLDQYAEASLTLGQLFTENKEFPSAEKTLNRILKFAQDNGGAYYEAKAQIYLAESKIAQGDHTSAKPLLESAKVSADKMQATGLQALIKAAQSKLK